MKLVTLVVFNDLTTDQRVHKIASTLAEKEYKVEVVGGRLKNSPNLIDRNYSWHRIFRRFTQGKLAYIEFQCKVFYFLLRQKKSNILVANDLDTLLPVWLAAICKGSFVIYDSHEHFTEVPELLHRPITRKIWATLQQFLAPKVHLCITVNQALAQVLSQKLKIPVEFIRNVPSCISSAKVLTQEKILLYQGAVNLGRGIEFMIQTMSLLPEWKLWIIGGGDLYTPLKNKYASEQIIFFGKIPFENLSEWTSQARIGLSLEENLGENYRIATPNKVFDYVQHQIPVIMSDLPGLRSLWEEFAVGELLSERTNTALATLIKKIDAAPEQYSEALKAASKAWNWEKESQKLLKLYQTLDNLK